MYQTGPAQPSMFIYIRNTTPAGGTAVIRLMDMYGLTLLIEKMQVAEGLTNVGVYGLIGLSPGGYALQVRYDGQQISRRIVKPADKEGETRSINLT
jgi:hypothetical protein